MHIFHFYIPKLLPEGRQVDEASGVREHFRCETLDHYGAILQVRFRASGDAADPEPG
jgi:hypothetical protein